MKKIIIIFVFVFSTCSIASSQSDFGTANETRHYLGAAASSISGWGLSYKVNFLRDFAVETTGFIYYWEDEDNKDLIYSIGGEFHYNLYRTDKTIFYLLVGLSKRFYEDHYIGYYWNEEYYQSSSSEHQFAMGPGFGIEFELWDHIVFTGELGFQYYQNKENYSDYYQGTPRTSDATGFFIGGGVGMYYKF